MKMALRISGMMLALLVAGSMWGMRSTNSKGYEIILLNSYKEPIRVQVVSKGRVYDSLEEGKDWVVPAGGVLFIKEGEHTKERHLKWWKLSSKMNMGRFNPNAKYMSMPYEGIGSRYMIIAVRSTEAEKKELKGESKINEYVTYLDRSRNKPEGWDALLNVIGTVSQTDSDGSRRWSLSDVMFDETIRQVLDKNFHVSSASRTEGLSQVSGDGLTFWLTSQDTFRRSVNVREHLRKSAQQGQTSFAVSRSKEQAPQEETPVIVPVESEQAQREEAPVIQPVVQEQVLPALEPVGMRTIQPELMKEREQTLDVEKPEPQKSFESKSDRLTETKAVTEKLPQSMSLPVPQKNAPRLFEDKNFEKVALRFIKFAEEKLQKGTWISEVLNFKEANKTFVQKKQIPNDADIKFATDIHGNGQLFFKWLQNLQDEGFLDKNNPYKITKKNGYIALLGDYIDRGTQGIDVLLGAMLLYLNNPDNVIMLKGNHEDSEIYTIYGFMKEIGSDVATGAIADTIFERLPSACFFMWENEQKQKQCILSVHGGPNFGYQPKALLSNTATDCYETVPYNSIALSTIEPDVSNEFARSRIGAKEANAFAWVDFAKSATFYLGRFGVTKKNMLEYFKQSIPDDVHLVAVVRGHQNTPRRPGQNSELIFLDTHGIDIYDSLVQFEQPGSTVSLDTSKDEPLLITIGSFIDNSSSRVPLLHKTTLDLILKPELKDSVFVRKAIDLDRKPIDYKINLKERIKVGIEKLQ